MKKWYVLIGVCFFAMMIFTGKQNKVKTVFEETNSNEFRLVKIDVSNSSLTTKNITSLLDALTLYKVTFEVPNLYKNKFSNQNTEYSFFGLTNKKGLEEIEKKLSKEMKTLGNIKEVEKIAFYGVKLLSIEVYGKTSKIEELKQKLEDY